MNLLLDTHVALWLLHDHPALGAQARLAITEADSVHVSVASIWEISIKHSIGKMGPPEPVVDALRAARIALVDVAVEHAVAVARTPLSHGDPFDRLITAQASTENWTLVTADAKILSANLPAVMDARL